MGLRVMGMSNFEDAGGSNKDRPSPTAVPPAPAIGPLFDSLLPIPEGFVFDSVTGQWREDDGAYEDDDDDE